MHQPCNPVPWETSSDTECFEQRDFEIRLETGQEAVCAQTIVGKEPLSFSATTYKKNQTNQDMKSPKGQKKQAAAVALTNICACLPLGNFKRIKSAYPIDFASMLVAW